jgi:hypothetical protein
MNYGLIGGVGLSLAVWWFLMMSAAPKVWLIAKALF